MPDNTTPGLIAVLAAGRGTRFGADKLATPCAGRPLGQWAQAAALGAGLPVVCVVGPHSALPCLAGVERMVNPLADEGLGTSLALAARVAMARGAPFLLVMLGDMPLVTAALLGRLLALGAPVACLHDADGDTPARPGVPALFGAAMLPQLAQLGGPRGATGLLAGLAPDRCLAAPDLLDVDTPAALAQAEARLLARQPLASTPLLGKD